jgi:hypothetical protein
VAIWKHGSMSWCLTASFPCTCTSCVLATYCVDVTLACQLSLVQHIQGAVNKICVCFVHTSTNHCDAPKFWRIVPCHTIIIYWLFLTFRFWMSSFFILTCRDIDRLHPRYAEVGCNLIWIVFV